MHYTVQVTNARLMTMTDLRIFADSKEQIRIRELEAYCIAQCIISISRKAVAIMHTKERTIVYFTHCALC